MMVKSMAVKKVSMLLVWFILHQVSEALEQWLSIKISMSTVWNTLHQVSEALELSSFMEKISSSRLNETIDGEVRPSFMSSSLSSSLSKPYDRHHQHNHFLQASELGELGIQDWARLWVQVVWTFCFTIRTLVFTYFTLNKSFFHISLLIHCSGFRDKYTHTGHPWAEKRVEAEEDWLHKV